MKRIGIIGGSGWPSTLEYYRLLNTYFCEKVGNDHSIDLVLRSLDFAHFRKLTAAGKTSDAVSMLNQGIKECENAGADFIMFAANGLHSFVPDLKNKIPLLHIAECTARAISKRNLRTVGLLGVKVTMEGDFYPQALSKLGIAMLTPNESARAAIHDIIFSELVQNVFTEATKQLFLNTMNDLVKNGAEGIILGCTEIPLLIKESDTAIMMFSTTEIHCRAAVELAMS